jgi:hypothetical protein
MSKFRPKVANVKISVKVTYAGQKKVFDVHVSAIVFEVQVQELSIFQIKHHQLQPFDIQDQ